MRIKIVSGSLGKALWKAMHLRHKRFGLGHFNINPLLLALLQLGASTCLSWHGCHLFCTGLRERAGG